MAWYEEFFDELYLAEYLPLLPPERTAAEVESIIAILGLPPGSRILDLCCGHGRHSVELAARGYEVCGQDLSPLFLAAAARSAAERGVSLSLKQGDMRQILFDPPFDAVINLFTAFGYFDDDDDEQRVLDEVSRVLRPRGQFLIEIVNRDGIMRQFRHRDWTGLPDGTHVVSERRFDPLTGRNHEVRGYILPDGTRRMRTTSVRLFAPSELARMITAAGLSVEAAFGDLSCEPLSIDSTRMVLLARKPDDT